MRFHDFFWYERIIEKMKFHLGNNHSPANVTNNDNEWTSLSPKSLWKQINEEAESYYKFELNSDNVDGICEVFDLQKVSLMRAVCKAAGIQLVLREYSLDNNGKIFTDEDVINVFPVVKHINPRATDAYNFYTTGQSKIQQGMNFIHKFIYISKTFNLHDSLWPLRIELM